MSACVARPYLPAYERALLAALRDIVDEIPHRDLSIQWDVCQEVLVGEHYIPHSPPTYCVSYLRRRMDLHLPVPKDRADDAYFAPRGDPGACRACWRRIGLPCPTPQADELWVVCRCEERSDAAISVGGVQDRMKIAALRPQ